MAANHAHASRAADGEKDHASSHGTPKTKAATAPNAGEIAAPSAMPETSASAPTASPSATRTAASSGARIPSRPYVPNSRERRRTMKRLA